MSIVSNIRVCSFCKSDITAISNSANKDQCPVCGKLLKTPKTNYFGLPDYLRLQMDSLLKEGGPDKIKLEDQRYAPFIIEVEQELTNLARECSDEDRVAAMSDAYKFLAEVMHSNASRECIQSMVYIGKKMGKLAEAIEHYFIAGGMTNDRKVNWISPPPGDDSWNQAAATAGGDRPG